ncbi:MAG: hypothetical protein A2142_01040 [candidate division Zixibacteria bacterium RBG_16_48_11]|nr:MAG: hypothetical protein A2142_01040 [candidate division Zixibacteria bacterium RBG_16_48_11]
MKKSKLCWIFGSLLLLAGECEAQDLGIKIFGDLGFRYQGLYDVDTTYLNDLEMKFRLGFSKKVNERITALLRFETGPQSTPTGTWITMGDKLTKTSFLLNRAYLDYRTQSGFDFIVGKFDNPFVAPVYGVGASELVFDADVPFTGVALGWNQTQEGEWKEGLRVMADYNSLTFHYSSKSADTSAYSIGGEVAYKFPFGLVASLSDVFFNQEGIGDFLDGNFPDSISGLTTNSAGLDEFNLLNLTARYETTVSGKPLAILGDWVVNTKADSLQHGILGDLSWGSAKEKTNWQLGFRFTWIQQDAVISKLTEDQSGTNLVGFMPWLKFKPLDNTLIFFTLLVTDIADGPDQPIKWRPRLYYIVNF